MIGTSEMIHELARHGISADAEYMPKDFCYAIRARKGSAYICRYFKSLKYGDSEGTEKLYDIERKRVINEIIEKIKEYEDDKKEQVFDVQEPKKLYITTTGTDNHTVFEDFIKAKEKKMGNSITWKVKNLTLNRHTSLYESDRFDVELEGVVNGVVTGDLVDITNKLQKKLSMPDNTCINDYAYLRLPIMTPSTKLPAIEKVIFNNPATIVFWKDGTKTVVKAQNNDIFDPEKGLAMAITKKALGNEGNYFDKIKKWTGDYESASESKKYVKIGELVADGFAKARNSVNNLASAMSAQADLVRREAAAASLTNALNNKKVTKAELKIAMEHAIRTLGGVTPDA